MSPSQIDWLLTALRVDVPAHHDEIRDRIEDMDRQARSALASAATSIAVECRRATEVDDALDRLTVADQIGRAVQTSMMRQAAAIDMLIPRAARRGHGIQVLTATGPLEPGDQPWSVEFAPTTPPWTVAHRRVDRITTEETPHAD